MLPAWSVGPDGDRLKGVDYGLVPPEINSERIHAGPGAGSFLAAAEAWGRISDGLDEAADGFRGVTALLNCGWQGTAAIAMTQAAAPYLGWLSGTAAKGRQTAAHATAAAAAYEEAQAAMVPSSLIAANRSHRTSVADDNSLAQDAEALASMDADYDQMWARDVEAMYNYAGASAEAARVTPFTSTPLAFDLPALAQQGAVGDSEAIAVASQLVSTLPQVLQSLSAAPLTSFGTALTTVSAALAKLSSLAVPVKFPMHLLNFLGRGPVPVVVREAATPATVRARWGGGASIGRLSVPPAWGELEPPSPAKADLYRLNRRMRTIGGLAVNGSLVYS